MEKYIVTKPLGKVDRSAVFLGEEKATGQKVALKLFSRPTEEEQHKLLNQAKILKTLNHPNIVRVLDAGLDEEGNVFYAMEYLAGDPLYKLIPPDEGMPFQEIWPTIKGISDGVQALHEAGILHLDIKPGNILVENGVAKLIDIGILIPEKRGKFRGTPGYIAPEIILGQPASKQSDIYSLGALLAYMLTGHKLFSGDSPEDTLARQLKDFSESLHQKDLARVIQRATKQEPDKRYQEVSDMLKALSLYEHEQEFEAEEPSEDPAQTEWGNWVIGSVVVILVSIAIGIYYSLLTSI
ncbi:MAG: serine/threonine protein kinase [Deltaproteobacteria bacterium]|nr:serine/threonine protein kinase [Deltaproteobacteria bacterium]